MKIKDIPVVIIGMEIKTKMNKYRREKKESSDRFLNS